GAIELSVRDEAPALAPEERERVFERFYRAPQARRGDAPGSGLGLAIVQWAVKLHGGEVRVEPGESGRGNVFVVTFPRGAEPPSLSDLPERPAGVRLSARPRGA